MAIASRGVLFETCLQRMIVDGRREGEGSGIDVSTRGIFASFSMPTPWGFLLAFLALPVGRYLCCILVYHSVSQVRHNRGYNREITRLQLCRNWTVLL